MTLCWHADEDEMECAGGARQWCWCVESFELERDGMKMKIERRKGGVGLLWFQPAPTTVKRGGRK